MRVTVKIQPRTMSPSGRPIREAWSRAHSLAQLCRPDESHSTLRFGWERCQMESTRIGETNRPDLRPGRRSFLLNFQLMCQRSRTDRNEPHLKHQAGRLITGGSWKKSPQTITCIPPGRPQAQSVVRGGGGVTVSGRTESTRVRASQLRKKIDLCKEDRVKHRNFINYERPVRVISGLVEGDNITDEDAGVSPTCEQVFLPA